MRPKSLPRDALRWRSPNQKAKIRQLNAPCQFQTMCLARAKPRSEDFDLAAKTQSVQIVSKLQHFLPEDVNDVTIAADQTLIIPASTHAQDLGQASPDTSVTYQQCKGVVDLTSDGECKYPIMTYARQEWVC